MPIDVLSSQNRSFPAAAVIRETNEELFLQVCRLLDKKAALLRLIAQSTGTWGFWLCIDIHSGCKALLVSPERMQGASGVAREDARCCWCCQRGCLRPCFPLLSDNYDGEVFA
jgi:hypothetical protein